MGRGYLGLAQPAMITIGADGHDEIVVGALRAGLDLGDGPSIAHFTWPEAGKWARSPAAVMQELLDDGTIEITFAYHNGDEALLKVKRQTSLTDGVIGVYAEGWLLP